MIIVIQPQQKIAPNLHISHEIYTFALLSLIILIQRGGIINSLQIQLQEPMYRSREEYEAPEAGLIEVLSLSLLLNLSREADVEDFGDDPDDDGTW